MNIQLAKQYFERAEALRDAGKPEEALALLNQLDEAFPNTKNIGVARARTYAAMGRISEAVQLCDALIEVHESRRAHELKEQLLRGVVEPDANATQFQPKSSGLNKGTVGKWALVAVFIGVIAWAALRLLDDSDAIERNARARQLKLSVSNRTQADTPASFDGAGNAVGRTVSKIPKPVSPGTNHPQQTWELDGAGVPIWKSGIYHRVPCINDPERTLDLYLPLAYDAKPEALFPGVVIQMPSGNPGFIGLASWAERSEVVLIVINSSKNATFSQNHIAQDHALETIAASTLRVDQRMGFAIGMSGGGRASWQIACRYPENFRGIVMMGISGDEDVFMPPLYVRIAIIHGETDFNNLAIERALRRLKRHGYQVREAVVPGGHVTGPPRVRIEMLDWMVSAARVDLGLPLPAG